MTMETKDGRVADGEQALVSDQAPAGLDASGFDPSRLWADVRQVPYSTMGYGGGTMLLNQQGACVGYVIVLNKSAHHDPKALDAAVHRAVKDRTAAIRWANQSVEMLQEAFFPIADALRGLEIYLRLTPHHNAPEAAAARKALAVFDDAQGTEARRAETGTGSVHDGQVAASDAPHL